MTSEELSRFMTSLREECIRQDRYNARSRAFFNRALSELGDVLLCVKRAEWYDTATVEEFVAEGFSREWAEAHIAKR